MNNVSRTAWLGMAGALLIGAPSLAAAQPAGPGATSTLTAAPPAGANTGGAPAAAATTTPQEAQPSAPTAPASRPPGLTAYSSPYSSPYAYPYPYPYAYPPSAPPSREGATYWYGWETLMTLGVSSSFVLLAFTTPTTAFTLPSGVGGLVLGGPIVHWANGNTGKGFISLGMNVGAALLGSVLGAAAICSGGCSGEFGGYGGALIGAPVGILVSTIVDVSLLTYGERRAPFDSAAGGRRSSIGLAPTFDLQPGRASVGLMGTF